MYDTTGQRSRVAIAVRVMVVERFSAPPQSAKDALWVISKALDAVRATSGRTPTHFIWLESASGLLESLVNASPPRRVAEALMTLSACGELATQQDAVAKLSKVQKVHARGPAWRLPQERLINWLSLPDVRKDACFASLLNLELSQLVFNLSAIRAA